MTNIKVVEQETDDATQDGRVTDQAPAAGTRIRQGDRVTIFVARVRRARGRRTPSRSPTTTSTPRQRGLRP